MTPELTNEYMQRVKSRVKEITKPFLVSFTDEVNVFVCNAEPGDPLKMQPTVGYKFISKNDGLQYGSVFFIPSEDELEDMLSEVTEQVGYLLLALIGKK